jgi:hypothetical protein
MFNLFGNIIENCFTKWLILNSIQNFIALIIGLILAIAFLIFMIAVTKMIKNNY